MGLREWLIILGGVVLLLIIADGIRRMRKNGQEEEMDPEERARQEQIRRELPNGGARIVKEHNPETFENDPVPVLKYEVEVPEGTLQEMEFNAADIPDRELPEGAKRYSEEDYQHLFKKAEPETQPEADVAEPVEEQKAEPELDNTDSSYFDAFCHTDKSTEPESQSQPEVAEPAPIEPVQEEVPVQVSVEDTITSEVTTPEVTPVDDVISEIELVDSAPQMQVQEQIETSDVSQSADIDVMPVTEESSVLEDAAREAEQAAVSAQGESTRALDSKPGTQSGNRSGTQSDVAKGKTAQKTATQQTRAQEKAEPDDLEPLDMDAAFAAEQAKLQTEQELQREAEALFPETAPKTEAEPEAEPEPEDPVKAAARRIMGKHMEGPRPSEKLKLEEQRKAARKAKEAVAKEQAQKPSKPKPQSAAERVKSKIGTEPQTSPYKEKKVTHKPLMTAEEERAQFSNAVELLILHVKAKDPAGFPGSVLLHIALACGMQVGEMGVFHRFKKTDEGARIDFSMVSSVNPGTFDIDNIDELHVPGVSFIMALPSAGNSQESFHIMHETAKVVVKNLNGELRDENRSVMTPQTVEHYRQRIQEFERRRQLAERAATRT